MYNVANVLTMNITGGQKLKNRAGIHNIIIIIGTYYSTFSRNNSLAAPIFIIFYSILFYGERLICQNSTDYNT